MCAAFILSCLAHAAVVIAGRTSAVPQGATDNDWTCDFTVGSICGTESRVPSNTARVPAPRRDEDFDEALPRRESAREKDRIPTEDDATTIFPQSQPDLPTAAKTPSPAHRDPEKSAALPPSIASLPSRGEDGKSLHSSGGGADEYLGMIRRRISEKKEFPAEALNEGMRGIALVGFRLHRGGTVDGVRIVRSSRSPILDSEAQMTVRRAAPFPPIPGRFSGDSMDIQVPISFEIERR